MRLSPTRFYEIFISFEVFASRKHIRSLAFSARNPAPLRFPPTQVDLSQSDHAGMCRRFDWRNGSIQMLDVLMIAMAAGFFALAIGYAYACERL